MAWYDSISDKFIANVANKYMQDNIWGPFNIFPKVNVKQKSGLFAKFSKEDWLRMDDVNEYIRTGASESKGDIHGKSSQSYLLEQFAFHEDVTEEDRDNYDNPYDPIADATDYVVNKLQLLVAKKFATSVLASGIWSTNYDVGAGSTKWNASGATPIDDVLGQAEAIEKFTGFWPNRICMTRDVELALATCDDILDVMAVTNTKVVTKDLLATIFKVDTVEVFATVATTAAKGGTATTSNTNYMATDTCVLCYTPDRATTKKPSAGIHPVYKGKGGNVITRRIPMPENNNALRVEGMVYTAPVIMAADLGARLHNIV